MVSKKHRVQPPSPPSRGRTESTATPLQVTLTLMRPEIQLGRTEGDHRLNLLTLVPLLSNLDGSLLIFPCASSITAPQKATGAVGSGASMSDYTTQNKQMRHDELFRLYLVFQEMRIAGVQVI
jgi:hypothetical protein